MDLTTTVRKLVLGTLLVVSVLLAVLASAADSIKGRVLGGGAPIASSTVTLWAEGADAPKQLAQAQTGNDGRFEVRVSASQDVILYLVATGGEPTANKAGGDNPAIALLTVVGSKPPAQCGHQRVHDRGVRLDARAIHRRHDDQGSRARLRIAAGNRAQLRRSGDRRMGWRNPRPAQQRPDADDGQLRHAGRPALRVASIGLRRMPAAACSRRLRHRVGALQQIR